MDLLLELLQSIASQAVELQSKLPTDDYVVRHAIIDLRDVDETLGRLLDWADESWKVK